MLSTLSPYLDTIFKACLLFPLAAGVFTIPFMILNYRKYGGIALMRVIVVYSFILYSMCAFLLTVLPLPSQEAVAAMAPRPIGWIPFTDLSVGLKKAGFFAGGWGTWLELSRWKRFLLSRDFFQILANVVMQIPLGFYLRYYFRCSWKKAAIIGFLVSLFYELTQLSGLFFIYPKAYRFASVDDLITNTLGAMIGYAVTPLLALLLPSRDQIDRISYRKGEHLTLLRRALAAVLDLSILGMLTGGVAALVSLADTRRLNLLVPPVCFLVYFVLIPRLSGGHTPGQGLLKIRVVQEKTLARPALHQLLVRNLMLYLAEPFLALIAMAMLMGMVITLTAEGLDTAVFLFLLCGSAVVLLSIVWFFLHSLLRWNTLPHGHFSHTRIALVPRDKPARHANNTIKHPKP